MKVIRRMFYALLCVVFMCAPALTVKADDGYTYTVRFYAGKQGTLKSGEQGGELKTFTCSPGAVVTFRQSDVKLKDGSKYYVKGIRESGKDNNTIGLSSFTVTGDQDYVVAYGLLNDAVAYTINYVEASTGRVLADSETYYGNVGDKPVIAYLYIEGYQPQAYNLTKTLSENAAENVFTFRYTYVGAAAAPGTHTTTVTETDLGTTTTQTGGPGSQITQGATGTTQTTQGQGGQIQGGGNAAGAGDDAEAGAGDENEAGVELPDEATPLAAPEELIDIDDEEVPLGIYDSGREIVADAVILFRRSTAARVLGVIAFLAVAGGFIYYMFVRKRIKNKE